MRLIDADALKYNRIRIFHDCTGMLGGYHAVVMSSAIKDAPTIDAVPVVHSKWLLNLTYNPSNTFRVSYDGWMHCPVCAGAFRRIVGTQLFNYCPNCGAKMDGEEECST